MPPEVRFSTKQRIALMTLSSAWGGLEMTTIKLATEFSRRNAECQIIALPTSALVAQARAGGLRLEFLRPKLRYGDIFAAWKLARILRAYQIDLLLLLRSHDIHLAAAARIVYPSTKLVFYQQMQSGTDKRDIFHTWMYSKLSLWITLTSRMTRQVLEHTRMPPHRVKQIPLGRNTQHFDPNNHDSEMLKRNFEFPLDKLVVGMVGRLDPGKGQEEFLRALAAIPKKYSVAGLVAGEETRGEEGYKSRLFHLCETLGLKETVKFIPFTQDVAALMAAMDIFVLPSHDETYGLVLLEAMAMQKPVIATNAGGVPDIVTHERDGLLVPPRNPEALAEGMVRLIEDEELRRRLAKNARQTVANRFEEGKCVDELVRTLEQV